MHDVIERRWRPVPCALFARNEDVLELSDPATLLLYKLFRACDDFGRFPRATKALMASLPWLTPGLPRAMSELVKSGLVVAYEVKGRQYGYIRDYLDMVALNWKPVAVYPEPPGVSGTPSDTLPKGVSDTPRHTLPDTLPDTPRDRIEEIQNQKTAETSQPPSQDPVHPPRTRASARAKVSPGVGDRVSHTLTDTPQHTPSPTPSVTPSPTPSPTPSVTPQHTPPVPRAERMPVSRPEPAPRPVPPEPVSRRGEPEPFAVVAAKVIPPRSTPPPKPLAPTPTVSVPEMSPRAQKACELWHSSLAMVSSATVIAPELLGRLVEEFGDDIFVAAVENHVTSEPRFLAHSPLANLRRRCEWAKEKGIGTVRPNFPKARPKPVQGMTHADYPPIEFPPPDEERNAIVRGKGPHPDWWSGVGLHLSPNDRRSWLNPVAVRDVGDSIEIWGPDESHTEAVQMLAGPSIIAAAPKPVVFR